MLNDGTMDVEATARRSTPSLGSHHPAWPSGSVPTAGISSPPPSARSGVLLCPDCAAAGTRTVLHHDGGTPHPRLLTNGSGGRSLPAGSAPASAASEACRRICIARQCRVWRGLPDHAGTSATTTTSDADAAHAARSSASKSSSRWAEASDCPIAFSIRCRSAGSGAASRQSKNTRVTRRGSIRVAITDMTAASMDHRRVPRRRPQRR